MPTNLYPITINDTPENTILELQVLYTPDVDYTINIVVVNGKAVETIPYHYIGGETNTLRIVDMTSNLVSVVFTHPTDLSIEDFSVVFVSLSPYTRETDAPLENVYRPLHNFYDNNGSDISDDRNYNSAFRTDKLNITSRSVIDLKIQPSYDGSVNMIWSDDTNPIRIVNSRFSVDETGTIATLIDRRARKDANTYNELALHQTELIPRTMTIPTLTFNGFIPGGQLPGGGYRYFFRYITADGAETDIVEESRLVSVHEGSTTTNAVGMTGVPTTNTASFTLTNVDTSFYGVVVYYTISTGEVDSVDVAYKINDPFIIENGGICNVVHTGYENKTLVNIESLSLTYSVISRSKTMDVVNNRLLVGNGDTYDVYNETLANTATMLMINEGDFQIEQHSRLESTTATKDENNYSSPKFIYDSLGLWKGETYELGIVFITDSGPSPVYPIQGRDNISDSGDYNIDLLGTPYRGFVSGGQNSLGVYRTAYDPELWSYAADKLYFNGTRLIVDVDSLKSLAPDLKINGFFFVRRKRKQDVVLQGLLTPVAAVPIETKFGSEYEISGLGNYCGVGVTSSVAKGNVKFVPAPGGMMPFGVEEVDKGTAVFQAHRNAIDVQNATADLLDGDKIALDFVEGLRVSDTIRFVGLGDATIIAIDYTLVKVQLSAAPTFVIPINTLIEVSRTGVTGVSTDFYIKAPIKDYDLIKSFALYSPDIECNSPYYASILNGKKMGIKTNRAAFSTEQINATSGQEAPIGENSALYQRITGPLTSTNELAGDKSAYASFVDTGAMGCAPKGFSGVMDRNLYCYWGQQVGSAALTAEAINTLIDASTDPFSSGNPIGLGLAYRPGNALAYGKYVGLKMDGSTPNQDLSDLSIPEQDEAGKNTHCYNSLVGYIGDSNGFGTQLGYVTRLYNNVTGEPLGPESWKARYSADEDTEYFAVTQRYRYSDFFDGNGGVLPGVSTSLSIYGGDCFLGMAWKQVWYPLGIAEAPQTNDITAYKSTRRSLGLLPYGYAIPVPAQSNYNFNIRSKERVDDREFKVYGTDRSFLPLKGKDSIRGNRQFETSAYNKGYNAGERSAFKQFRLNLNAPFYRYKYPNRIYASSVFSENEFVNGFSNFKGLNYKDYNTNMGAITKLICLNNVLISVFKDGVAQIGVDERSVLSQNTGDIFVDNAQVLSRSNMLNSEYGSSHLHAVCASNNFVYGVDFTRLKIWRTNGEKFEIISDLKIQNKLGSISKDLLREVTDVQSSWIDIFAHFDSRKNEIYFTFSTQDYDGNNLSRTLVYNETIQIWVCETDDVRKYFFQSSDARYALPSVDAKYNKLYKYAIGTQANLDPTTDVFGEYNKFYDEIFPMYFDYHVVDELSTYKIYSNIYVVGNNSLPSRVSYTSDNNTLTRQTLRPYTNIRHGIVNDSGEPTIVAGVIGTQVLYVQNGATIYVGYPSRSLSYGDFVSIPNVGDPINPYYFVVIDYDGTGTITVDRPLPIEVSSSVINFGWGLGIPMRLTDSSFEESYGVISCQLNNISGVGMDAKKLRGKWMRFRQYYEGTAPVYISGIITDYVPSLS